MSIIYKFICFKVSMSQYSKLLMLSLVYLPINIMFCNILNVFNISFKNSVVGGLLCYNSFPFKKEKKLLMDDK